MCCFLIRYHRERNDVTYFMRLQPNSSTWWIILYLSAFILRRTTMQTHSLLDVLFKPLPFPSSGEEDQFHSYYPSLLLRDGPLFFWRGGGGGGWKISLCKLFFYLRTFCKQFFSNNTFLQTIFFRSFLTTIWHKKEVRFCCHQSLFNSIFYGGDQ